MNSPGLVVNASNASFALNAARIVSCVLTTVPMVSPGSSGLVSIKTMMFT